MLEQLQLLFQPNAHRLKPDLCKQTHDWLTFGWWNGLSWIITWNVTGSSAKPLFRISELENNIMTGRLN